MIRHGENYIIGASILHNHFQIEQNELIAVNSTNRMDSNIKFVIHPLSIEYGDKLVPYMFKFHVSEAGEIMLYSLQYIVC